MKKILAILFAGLLVPVACLAAGAGGFGPDYHMVSTALSGSGVTPWSTTADQDTLLAWTIASAASETTLAVDTRSVVCPMGAGIAYCFYSTTANAGDSLTITPQYSCDKSTWVSGTAVNLVNGTPGIVVEAATLTTTPSLWPYTRFIITEADVSVSASLPSTSIWWVRYEKDDD